MASGLASLEEDLSGELRLSQLNFSARVVALFSASLLAAGLVTGCGDSNDSPPVTTTAVPRNGAAPPPAETADLDPPGPSVVGKAGDNILFRVDETPFVVRSVGKEFFLEDYPRALPVPNARIVYPDGSEQAWDPSRTTST